MPNLSVPSPGKRILDIFGKTIFCNFFDPPCDHAESFSSSFRTEVLQMSFTQCAGTQSLAPTALLTLRTSSSAPASRVISAPAAPLKTICPGLLEQANKKFELCFLKPF